MIHPLHPYRLLRVALTALLAVTAACGGGRDAATDQAGRRDTTPAAAPDTGPAAAHDAEMAGAHEDDEAPPRVTLSESAMRTAAIRTEVVGTRVSAATRRLVVPGQVQFDPRRVALVSPRAPGRIERLTVVEGDRVRAGQAVAFVLSPPFLTAQTDFLQATRRASLVAGTADSAGAAVLADAARRRLRLLGLEDDEIARLAASGQPADYLPLASPLSGTITKAHLLPGAAVEPGTPVFQVADLSVMDVVAEVPEQSLPLVRIGQTAAVSIAAYPGMSFDGQVERLSGELNPETRTVQAVVHVPNRGERLRAGMFATAALAVAASDRAGGVADTAVTIPESALVVEGERRFVFVELAPGTFERREVEVASLTTPGSMVPAQGRVAVRRGVAAGDRVVVTGAFTLKSELAKAGLGEHGH